MEVFEVVCTRTTITDTLLKERPIGIVKQVPLDYMPLVCLGLVHKLLMFWFKGHCCVSTLHQTIATLSSVFAKLINYYGHT